MRARNRRRLPWFVICCAFAGIVAFSGNPARSDEPKKEKPLRVCLLSGCNTYHSEKSLPPFQEWLEKNYRVECTRLVRKADDDLPGLEKLDECDVAFVFFKRMSLKGVRLKTAPGPLYKNAGHAKDITILLTGANPGHVEPLAWVREREGGRIFYTSLGDPTTFEDENFRRLLANAVFWTARREIPSK